MCNKFEDSTMIPKSWLEDTTKLKDNYELLGLDLAKPETFNLELTREELDFIYERCSRKAQRLEEAGLRDIPCYRLSWQVISKISNARNSQGE